MTTTTMKNNNFLTFGKKGHVEYSWNYLDSKDL